MIKGTKKEAVTRTGGPRISVNKMAEYLEANSMKRKSIVHDAKHPPKVKITRYSDARLAAQAFLISGKKNVVMAAIRSIRAKPAESPFEANDIKNSEEALRRLLECDTSAFEGYSLEPFNTKNASITIAGVEISVQPDAIVRTEVKGQQYLGGVKMSIAKKSLSDECQKHVAMMLYEYISQKLSSADEKASGKLCFSFDVFKDSVVCCPGGIKQRMDRLEASCEEIALRWPSA
jgi:hypothetical protein